MFSFNTPLSTVPKIGIKLTKKLSLLNLHTVGDLLYHFPHRYEDFSLLKQIDQLLPNEKVTLQGYIKEIHTQRTWRKKMLITEAFLEDATGSIKVIWFNLPAPTQYLSKNKPVQLSGKITLNKKNELILQHPNIAFLSQNASLNKSSAGINTGGLMPVYPETKGLTSYWFRRTIKQLLNQVFFEDFLPPNILKSQKLLPLELALNQIHFPSSNNSLSKAKQRLSFEKIFLFQIKALQAKKEWSQNQAQKIKFNKKLINAFLTSLPFTLTNAQKKSAWQIIKDLEKNQPMNRLLEGDVGTGKTIVACLAILSVVKQKHQVALLAPTEVLATQHFNNLKDLLSPLNISLALLTGTQSIIASPKKNFSCSKNTSAKQQRLSLEKDIRQGKINVIIGTHALLQKNVSFYDLALVVIDEQHRFGVNQRAHLQQKTVKLSGNKKRTIPHLLTMTATPIPRTLSLAIFGNLSLSIIDEFPRGRKKIITQVINRAGRNQVYAFIKKEVNRQRQVFIICPLVEESSKITEVKAATEEFNRLQKDIFPEFRLGLLHGKKKPGEKTELMRQFQKGKIDILVSTSVVEVGVDIPNATVMLIEGAERFGLSQLHQFRGRVGRSHHQSYCFLFTSDNAPENTARLRAMEKTNDGFKLAEKDLLLRGPGQFLGTAQSGLPDIAMDSLSDVKLIQLARQEAQKILSLSPDLKKFPLLRATIKKTASAVHME